MSQNEEKGTMLFNEPQIYLKNIGDCSQNQVASTDASFESSFFWQNCMVPLTASFWLAYF
jgi:hypothetical protein